MGTFKFDTMEGVLDHYFDDRLYFLEQQIKNNKNPFVAKAKLRLARTIKRDILEIFRENGFI